jgi:hypothetical protein
MISWAVSDRLKNCQEIANGISSLQTSAQQITQSTDGGVSPLNGGRHVASYSDRGLVSKI